VQDGVLGFIAHENPLWGCSHFLHVSLLPVRMFASLLDLEDRIREKKGQRHDLTKNIFIPLDDNLYFLDSEQQCFTIMT